MYPAAFEYHRVTSVEEAVGLLSRYKDDAKLLAGGHSLVPMMKLRLAQPKHLVDIGRIGGLAGVREDGAATVIGALTTHYAVESNASLKTKCPMLPEAAAMIGEGKLSGLIVGAGLLAGVAVQPVLKRQRTVERPHVAPRRQMARDRSGQRGESVRGDEWARASSCAA